MISVKELSDQAQAAFDYIRHRRYHYGQLFNRENEHARAVIEDLKQFCRADESCFSTEPYVMALMEGRREVWLRISNHLTMTDAQLFAKSSGSNVEVVELEDEDFS